LQVLFDIKKAEQAMQSPEDFGFLQSSFAPKSAEAEVACAAVFEEANGWLTKLRNLAGVNAEQTYYKPTDKNEFCIHTTKSAMTTLQRAVKQDSSSDWLKLSFKSLTSGGRLEHPSLDHFQQQLDTKRAHLKRCLALELPAVCIRFAEISHSWKQLEDWIVSIDLSLTMAKTATNHGWVRPTIESCEPTDVSRVQIQNLRHPLIESQKRQSKYVTHDISLGSSWCSDSNESGSGWLLYGMNASGKSSLMKAIGLAVLLAQVGSYVPATAMTLRPYKRLATRILNQDNLWAGLSSFAVEMSELREILAVADHQTLVLGDELCAGTESVSGTAIVAAGIQHLHKSRAQFVLATHLHDLMKLKEVTSLPTLRVYHLHVEYDIVKDRLVYHRTLREGPGSTLYGLEVAKALHLPNDMIESAFRLRRQLLGETAIEDGKRSAWSSDHFLRSCSGCGSKVVNTLEAHHLEQRKDAEQGRNKDGQALNHIRNLATLCQGCHDKHHAEQIHVGPVEDTSDGPVRSILDLSQYAYVPSQEEVVKKRTQKPAFTKEQLESIQATHQAHPHLHTKLLTFQIEKLHGFKVTEAQLKQVIRK
jgi:DNA mismatch repair ATPase MutS